MHPAPNQVREEGWWKLGQRTDFIPAAAMSTTPRLSTHRMMTTTPRGSGGGGAWDSFSRGINANTVRSRLDVCKSVEGMHAAISRFVHAGRADDHQGHREDIWAAAQLPAAHQAILTPRPRDLEESWYLGKNIDHREMSLKQYQRTIDKHLKQIKSRPVVDLKR